MNGSGQDSPPPRSSYSDAKTASFWSLAAVALIALVAVRWLPHPALAIATGGVCGVLNTWLTILSGERLLTSRSSGTFVISSFLRIGLFGIVPVAFAALGPWWSMAWYYAGFFLPLGLFAYGAARASRRK